MCERWVQKASQPQPFLTLATTVHPDDYEDLGLKPVTSQPRTATLTAMADTGCQSCLAGMKVIHRLGLNESDLIPVSLRMHAANNNGIKILGAAVLRFSGQSSSGETEETRQLVYATPDSDKLFLSREVCTALGMITKSFPSVGEVNHDETAADTIRHTSGPDQNPHPSCDCPPRQHPPP